MPPTLDIQNIAALLAVASLIIVVRNPWRLVSHVTGPIRRFARRHILWPHALAAVVYGLAYLASVLR